MVELSHRPTHAKGMRDAGRTVAALLLLPMAACYTPEQVGLRLPEAFPTKEAVQTACTLTMPDRFSVNGGRLLRAPWVGSGYFGVGNTDMFRLDPCWEIGSPMVVVMLTWTGATERDWLFLEMVEADNGIGKLDATIYDRQVGDRLLTEELLAVLPMEKVRGCSATGISFRASGKRGRREMTLPPHYVQGFLAACDAASPASK
jgi:hypothetical protein